jgi:twitching motility protein PilT
MENISIKYFLERAVKEGAADLFIIAGLPISYKIDGSLKQYSDEKLSPEQTERLLREIYEGLAKRDMTRLLDTGDDDFSFAIPGLSRFRACTYKQRGSLAAVIRIIAFTLPNYSELGIPDSIMTLTEQNKGLVLVTGPAGSGKSTTLACLIDRINDTKEKHIITLEDPLEFLHRHKKSIVSQREVGADTDSYIKALRSALRQSPDVILLGEMRDYETISVAMTAAETGHLVISTLHTIGAANTINRIIDVFPADQQRQISIQLASVLQAVVSQQLLPSQDGKLVVAFELMKMTPAIRNMIRENKIHQIDGVIYSSSQQDMFSMDTYLMNLYRERIISRKTALEYATNAEMMSKKIR